MTAEGGQDLPEVSPVEPTDSVQMTLIEALEQCASDLVPIERGSAADMAVTYTRAGRPFAVIEPSGLSASMLLSPAVADAALRTPDTALSPRGRGWIILRPRLVDGQAVDRATAWFESAWRHAGE